MPTFGEELRRLMKEKGLVQKKLADTVGVNQSFISKLVSGENTRLGADVMFALCDALGVSCDHFRPFLTDAEVSPAPPAEAEVKPARKGKKK